MQLFLNYLKWTALYKNGTFYTKRKLGLFLANQDYPADLKTKEYTLRKGDMAHKYKGILTFTWTIFLKR